MKKLDEMLEAIRHVHVKMSDLQEDELHALLQWVRQRMVAAQEASDGAMGRERFYQQKVADFHLAVADLIAMEPPFMEERQ